MATYGHDLTDIADGDGSDAGTWTEFTPYALGGTPANDGENFIQGVDCVSQTTGTKSGLNLSICYDYGSDLSGSMTSGTDVVMFWIFYAVGPNLFPYASGGWRIGIGSSTSAISSYDIGGSDYGRNPYGGWQNVVVDPYHTADYTDSGGNGGAFQVFGSIPYTQAAISKGTPHAMDAIRYGRGEIYCTGTDCTFSGMATYNDTNTASNYRRLGLFSYQGGIYLWKGLMSFGQTGTSATFSDSNKTIIIDDTAKVYSGFNKVEVNNSGTSVTLTNVSFTALGTNSPGAWENIDDATVTLTGCTFNDMNTFIFNSNTTCSSTFNSCGLVTQGGASISGSTFNSSTSSASILADNPTNITSSTFVSDGSNHAMELNTDTGNTYYSSDGTPTDSHGVWSSDANAYDGSTATSATTSSAGSTILNYLEAAGTNAPGSGSTITSVYVRIYGSVVSGDTLKATVATDSWAEELGTASNTKTTAGWGSFAALSTPTGGWTWAKVQALDTRLYKEGSAGTVNAYRVDIAVFTGSYTFAGHTFTSYASSDGSTGNEVVYNNSGGPVLINVTSGATPTIRNGTNASTVVVSAVTFEIKKLTYNARCRIENASTGEAYLSDYATTEDTDNPGYYKATTSLSDPGAISINIIVRQVGYLPFASTQTKGSGEDVIVTPVWQADPIVDKVDPS